MRETHRVGKKVQVKWQKYLGTAETILNKLEEAERLGRPARLKTESFAALFLADILEQQFDTIGIVDSIVPRARKEKGPTVGEYFFYAWANRLIAPKSKRALENWYRKTAIEHIRPVDLKQLTSERYWEKWERVSKRKKLYDFTRKMERLRSELIEYRRNYHQKEPHWRSRKSIISRYRKLCEKLYISHKYYRLSFTEKTMSFRKDSSQIDAAKAMMGKNIIVTDNDQWTTEEIVTTSLDRSRVKRQFRVNKASCHVRVNPMFHWTDSKIRCHLLTWVIALSCLRLLELKVGGDLSARTIMEEMHNLDCVLSWRNGAKLPKVQIEEPNEVQSQILATFGCQIKDGSVLHLKA